MQIFITPSASFENANFSFGAFSAQHPYYDDQKRSKFSSKTLHLRTVENGFLSYIRGEPFDFWGRAGLEDFSVARIFSPLTNKADIFFQSKSSAKHFLGDYLLHDFFFTPIRSGTALPSAKQQKSYPKDSVDQITKQKSQRTLYAREPPYGHIKEEEIQPVCIAYETVLC